MPLSKKKLLKPKEVSLDSPLKEETPNIELPTDENKLFDVDDDVGTSTIPDLSVKVKKKKSYPTMFVNMPLIFCSSSPHFILMEKVSEKWLNIKIWMIWSCFTNGMRNTCQLANFLLLIWRIHGINAIQNSSRPIPSRIYTCFGSSYFI